MIEPITKFDCLFCKNSDTQPYNRADGYTEEHRASELKNRTKFYHCWVCTGVWRVDLVEPEEIDDLVA